MEKAIIILFTLRLQQQRHRSRFCFAYDIIGSLAAISSIVSTILIRSWKKVFWCHSAEEKGVTETHAKAIFFASKTDLVSEAINDFESL